MGKMHPNVSNTYPDPLKWGRLVTQVLNVQDMQKNTDGNGILF